MRPNHAWPRLVAVVSAAALGTSACAGVQPVEPGSAPELGPKQGILAAHISTDIAIEQINFGFGAAIRNIPAGDHLILLVASEGSYRWTQIALSGRRRIRFGRDWGDDRRFRVKAGRINYFGMLELRGTHWLAMRGRTVDRSAVALDLLRARHPEVLERYPVVYTGPGQNVFFEHLRAAQPGRATAREAPSRSAGSTR